MINKKFPSAPQHEIIYFNYLRLFAIFAVIVLHVAGSSLYNTHINSFQWSIINFFDSANRWCVPVFIMISGALFLNKDISIKKIYSKYITHLLSIFFIWSAIYLLFYHRHIFTLNQFINTLLTGHYHMWFILMIIGLYMCVPFLRAIVQDNNRTKYYLLLSICFSSLIPTLFLILNDFSGTSLINISSTITKNIQTSHLNTVFGYSAYFVLGYYLSKNHISQKHRLYIYILGIIGLISSVILSTHCSIESQKACITYFRFLNFNILLESVAVFTWFQYNKSLNNKAHPIISKLSSYSLGVYLVHIIVLEQIVHKIFNLYPVSFNPILSIPCISVIVFIISLIISGILNKIPIAKKYIL